MDGCHDVYWLGQQYDDDGGFTYSTKVMTLVAFDIKNETTGRNQLESFNEEI